MTIAGAFTAANKFFDGTTSATITGRSVSNVVERDIVSLTGGSASFDTATVGVGKTVTGTAFTLAGTDAGNYQLASTILTTTANITFGTVSGFYAPVDMTPAGATAPVYNTLKGGSTVPLKFEVFAQPDRVGEQKTVEAIGAALSATKVSCESGATEAPVEVLASGSTSLRFDTTADQFIYNWKTPTTVGCYVLKVNLADKSSITAHFRVK